MVLDAQHLGGLNHICSTANSALAPYILVTDGIPRVQSYAFFCLFFLFANDLPLSVSHFKRTLIKHLMHYLT